jgi:epoxyqueuosine reductase
VSACPTGALRPDGLVDARRCVSYNTIENRGDLPPDVTTAIGNRVFGCDACQEVCPHNLDLPAGDTEFAGPASIDLHDVLAWDESQWDAATRGRAIRRATWRMWQRNARAAMAGRKSNPFIP